MLRAFIWLGLLTAALSAATESGIDFEPVDPDSTFPDAVTAGSLQRACAATEKHLEQFFDSRDIPFDSQLIQQVGGQKCHIYYLPTVDNFRADAEDQPISELLFNVDILNFLALRPTVFGDSLDISKALVETISKPLSIVLGSERHLDPRWYERAQRFHYGSARHSIGWSQSSAASPLNPWVQDYLKSGRADGKQMILVPRSLFEGRVEHGELFRPMLDSMAEKRFVRSKVSWEGGDLQFVQHPRDPSKLVLCFGDSAKAYWGDDLSQGEYAYVLQREFGADQAIDLSRLAPHTDYFVAFLPADRIALVAQPLIGNREIAEAAAQVLVERFEDHAPQSLLQLLELLQDSKALTARRAELSAALQQAKNESEGWLIGMDQELAIRISRHIAIHCPDSREECFSDAGVENLLRGDLPLLRDWTSAALRARTEAMMDSRLLSVIESQLATAVATQTLIDSKVRELQRLGFRVLRVPRIGGEPDRRVPWSGISYVNCLRVEDRLFVPQFGLGAAEDKIFEQLRSQLPRHYQVTPVFARHMLLYNGGVHCSVGIIRDTSPG